MIPKKLHYVWVGGKPIPNRVQEIINNAKSKLGSKWEIKIWTEKEFDVNLHPFTKYHYKRKNWAFVSDYIRAFAVYHEGGFYNDTDIYLNKTLDELIEFNYVASRTYVTESTMSIFGSNPKNKILSEYMKIFDYPKIIKIYPKIMSTHIHTYALGKYFKIPYENSDYISGKFAILSEDKLQIDLNNKKNIAIHEHHNNWNGKKDDNLKISKYYNKKVNFYQNITSENIKKQIKATNRLMRKISKIIT